MGDVKIAVCNFSSEKSRDPDETRTNMGHWTEIAQHSDGSELNIDTKMDWKIPARIILPTITNCPALLYAMQGAFRIKSAGYKNWNKTRHFKVPPSITWKHFSSLSVDPSGRKQIDLDGYWRSVCRSITRATTASVTDRVTPINY